MIWSVSMLDVGTRTAVDRIIDIFSIVSFLFLEMSRLASLARHDRRKVPDDRGDGGAREEHIPMLLVREPHRHWLQGNMSLYGSGCETTPFTAAAAATRGPASIVRAP